MPPHTTHTGKISEFDVTVQILVLLAAGLGTGYLLDVWRGHEFPTLFSLALFGSGISYIYSAPPLKLKQWGWAGNFALGSSYIALPWWAGQVRWGAGNVYGRPCEEERCNTRHGRRQTCITFGKHSSLSLSLFLHPLPYAKHLPPPRPMALIQALFGELSFDVCVLTVLYSIAGLGIAIVNDFKSIEGDRCHRVTGGGEGDE